MQCFRINYNKKGNVRVM